MTMVDQATRELQHSVLNHAAPTTQKRRSLHPGLRYTKWRTCDGLGAARARRAPLTITPWSGPHVHRDAVHKLVTYTHTHT
jgi:hypothetical protein